MDYKVKDNSRYAFSFQGSKIYSIFVALCGINLGLLLAANSVAFETNVDSKITANFAATGALDVTGALKAGSVDASSSAIVTSIADINNYTTIPTTSAVKTYVDAAIASGSSSTVSGGYPTQISQPKNLAVSLHSALAYCVGLTDDGGGWRLPTVDEFINACSRDEACRNEGSNGVLYRTATPVIPSTAHPYATPPWPDWVVANYWKLDAYTGVFEEPAAYVRCVK